MTLTNSLGQLYNISSQDLLARVSGPCGRYAESREGAIARVQEYAQPGDVVAVMGARDDTLSLLAQQVLNSL